MRIYRLIPVITMIFGIFAASTAFAATLWEEQFSGGTAGVQPGGWYDETDDGGLNAEINYDYADGYACVSVVASAGWGSAISFSQSVDLTTYDTLEVTISDIQGGTVVIGIFHPSPSYYYWACSASISTPGTYSFDIPTVTGESGTQTYGVQLTVEGALGACAVFDSVKIHDGVTGTSTFTPTASPTATETPVSGMAMLWEEHFSGGTAGVQPGGWYDETDDGGLNAEINYDYADSYACVSVVASAGWGSVISFSQSVDLTTYDTLEVTISDIQGGTVVIGIFHPSPSYYYWACSASISTPGTYSFDIPTVTGESGTQTYGVQLTVEGALGACAVFDAVRIYGSTAGTSTYTPTRTLTFTPTQVLSPTPTSTPTPTATETDTPIPGASPTFTPTPSPTHTVSPTNTPDAGTVDFWLDHFLGGSVGDQVTNWADETNNSQFNTEIAYSDTLSWAAVTRTADAIGWGKALSPNQTVDVDLYPMVEIVVTGISGSTSWRLGIQEQEGSYLYWDLSGSSQTGTGTFQYDYASATGWSGTHTFSVTIIVEGNGGAYIEADSVRIYHVGAMTATITPTIDLVNTQTATPTPSPTNTAVPDIMEAWIDHFEGTAGTKPPGWQDEADISDFNLNILFSDTYSYAALTRTADTAGWGKAWSPELTCDVSRYPIIEARIATVAAGANWRIGIQEIGGNNQFMYLDSGESSATGVFSFDYESLTSWSGEKTFRIQLVVVGNGGASVEVDYVRVYGYDYHYTPTPTASHTPSPTTTPFVSAKDFKAYPNPARDQVTFGFTAEGSVKATIDIYRTTGERVARIEEERTGAPGEVLEVAWNAVDVAPGIYFCRLVVMDDRGVKLINEVKKVAIIK